LRGALIAEAFGRILSDADTHVIACFVSAVEGLNTYKVGFGYTTEQWYEPFAEVGLGPITDPMQFADHVVFHKNGDPYAYLHKSLPGTINGGAWPAAFQEALADQTKAPMDLFTFTAQGDLPLKWTVKPSLAPTSYSRSVALTDDALRAWEASWQAYYKGGPKPAMPLAPGTNSPAPSSSVVVNAPEKAVTVNPPGPAPAQVVQVPVEKVSTNTITQTLRVAAKKSKAAKKRLAPA
jgi:hypothetical protein